jgi:hypothetical protein
VAALDATVSESAPFTDEATQLFPLGDRPADSSCVEEVDLSEVPLWLVSTEPETALAWSFPPRFYQLDECLYSWPAFSEPAMIDVEPADSYGLDRSGERYDGWDKVALVLEHSLLPSEGIETLRYENETLALMDATGSVLSSVDLRPINNSYWEEEIEWGKLSRIEPDGWRVRIVHDSIVDNTGRGADFRTTFTVAIEAGELRLIDLDYVGHEIEDPDELTREIYRAMVSWDAQEAVSGSRCWLETADVEPTGLGETYGISTDEYTFGRLQDFSTPPGRLVGERYVAEVLVDDVLWPNIACGVRDRERSLRVRWVLHTDEGPRVLVDQITVVKEMVGLEFLPH